MTLKYFKVTMTLSHEMTKSIPGQPYLRKNFELVGLIPKRLPVNNMNANKPSVQFCSTHVQILNLKHALVFRQTTPHSLLKIYSNTQYTKLGIQ